MYICMYICILIRYSKPNGKTELARYGLHNTQAKEMQFPPPSIYPWSSYMFYAGMVSKKNLMEIVKKLMSHMSKAEGTTYR